MKFAKGLIAQRVHAGFFCRSKPRLRVRIISRLPTKPCDVRVSFFLLFRLSRETPQKSRKKVPKMVLCLCALHVTRICWPPMA